MRPGGWWKRRKESPMMKTMPPALGSRLTRVTLEHRDYTLGLVASGQQLAAGPVTDSPAEDEHICGMGLYQQGSLDKVRELLNGDPGVRQGLYCFDVMTWHTPAGRIAFAGLSPAS